MTIPMIDSLEITAMALHQSRSTAKDPSWFKAAASTKARARRDAAAFLAELRKAGHDVVVRPPFDLGGIPQ